MKPVLSVKNLSLVRGRPLLQSVNWVIEPGQHWCLLGPNGSGKTLLLKTLLSYEAKTQGEIEVLGKAYGRYDWRILRKKIGWISNDLARKIPPKTTGLQVVLSGLNAGIGYYPSVNQNEKKRASEILNQVESFYKLQPSSVNRSLADQFWKFCSQGERQRLLIGRALLANYEILILDEPCSGLDPVSRLGFLDLLQTLIAEGQLSTLILVTHHVEEILPEITHVLMMKEGTVLCQGEKKSCLKASTLSTVFDAPVCLTESAGQYQLSVSCR